MTQPTKPSRWSYSSISTYESCPAKWHYSYILNLPGKPSAAMARGTRLHSDCERFLLGELPHLPWELNKVSLRLNDLKTIGAKPEAVWLLDQDWKVTIEQPWIKAIVDVHWLERDVLHVRDFKSGREYPEHREQLELYALIGLCAFPEVKRAEYAAIYLDTAHTSNEGAILRGTMAENKIKVWDEKAKRMFSDEQFLPNPGGACKWCDYAKSKGGPCDAA